MLSKRTSKNQITLPKEIVKIFQDTEYFDVAIDGNAIRLTPVRIITAGSSLEKMREKIEKLGLTDKDISGAVQWARKQRKG
ncbi:MAG: AbrB/MazE/SpoVT family DNA-binding domain-containing protein [Deltaproteobacteria bacterium]|nr:AbrB/MazE/SpoVT family DNA-binding domain-containing protein [Deltaproteobacteria bacterium]